MNKPKTLLHEESYASDWKQWVEWRLERETWDDVDTALKTIMSETNGAINPKWVIDSFPSIFYSIKDDSYVCDCGKSYGKRCKHPDKYRNGGCN